MTVTRALHFVLLILVTIVTSTTYASSLTLDLDRGKTNLVPYLEFNISTAGPQEAPPIEGWSQLQSNQVKFGFDDRTYWFRTQIQNNSQYPLSFYLEIGNPLLDNVSVYVLRNGKVKSVQHLGDQQIFHHRPVLHEHFVLPISFLADDELEIYIATQTSGTVNFPVFLWQKETFQSHQDYKRLLDGIFLGVILASIFAYAFTALYARSKTSALDAVLLSSLLLTVLTLNGLGFHYLWPNLPVVQQHASLLLAAIAIASSAFLAKEKIDEAKSNLLASRSFFITGIAALCLVPLCLWMSYQAGVYLVTAVAILICCCHVYSGVWMVNHGINEEQDLNVSVGILLFALVFIAINNFTATPLPLSNLALLEIAMLLMVSILSVSAIRKQLQTSEQLQQQLEQERASDEFHLSGFEAFESDKNTSTFEEDEDLRQKLAEQNLELQVTLRELEDRNTELEKLNTLDALSGIHNRRHFDKRIQAELRRARRELTPLSLILFDIDHFKKVNDTYGHVAGDEVIRAVALTTEEQLNRSTDEVFRYGGEEFAILLPNTEPEGAAKLAEKVRKAIEALNITTSSGTVNCTVSLGVSSSKQAEITEPNMLIDSADKALYKAKQTGRNKTVSQLTEEL